MAMLPGAKQLFCVVIWTVFSLFILGSYAGKAFSAFSACFLARHPSFPASLGASAETSMFLNLIRELLELMQLLAIPTLLVLPTYLALSVDPCIYVHLIGFLLPFL